MSSDRAEFFYVDGAEPDAPPVGWQAHPSKANEERSYLRVIANQVSRRELAKALMDLSTELMLDDSLMERALHRPEPKCWHSGEADSEISI